MSSGEQDGQTLVRAVDRRIGWAGLLCNGLGGVILFIFLAFLFPSTLDDSDAERLQIRAGIATGVLMAITLPLGRIWSHRGYLGVVDWLREGREADGEDRRNVLRYPLQFSLAAGLFWFIGSLTGWFLGLDFGLVIAETLMVAVLLGGLTACALQYLMVERLMRPITERALAGGDPPPAPTPGVAARITISWLLGTGVPLLGLVAIGLWELLGDEVEAGEIVGPTIFLAALALVLGLFAVRIAAGSVADPLALMRGSLQRVEQGEFDARVRVDDGSEVGRLQAGFNRMVTGLGEREKLRKAFGAYVDPDLAERVLREGTDLAGEEVEVSILFMDVRDFTGFSERASAREVVARLNELYEEVVPVISRNKGHANKFIGDGLLAVFGAPEKLDDHAERAVAAAREIDQLVRERFGEELRVGLGVNSGKVMAGTIGGGGRLDFTVIGDVVNTAARVESATRETGDDVLITDETLRRLGEPDDKWVERPGLSLKGKRAEVSLYAPRRATAAVP